MTEDQTTPSVDETIHDSAEKANPLDEFLAHQKRALDETGKAIESLLPPEFVKHAKAAGKEFSAGFKVLADGVIEELEKVAKKPEPKPAEGDDGRPSTTGQTKVKIQVE